MRNCDECGVELPSSEGHYDTTGFICDNCYFSKQPWHNDEEGEGELC